MATGDLNTYNMTERSEADAVADIALKLGEPRTVSRDELHLVLVPAGCTVQKIDHRDDADTPFRRQGAVNLHDGPSFASYIKDQAIVGSKAYVDVDNATFVAVLNDHAPAGGPGGWGDHRAVLTLRKTPEWKRWTGNDRKGLSQLEFAEFIEESAAELETPGAAEMLEIAQTFEAKQNVQFKTASFLQDGRRNLTWHETLEAGAGTDGHKTVPQQLTIAVKPFFGSDPFRLTARLRYKIRDGKLTLTYLLDHPELVVEEAVKDVKVQVETDTGLAVLYGTPPR